MVLPPERKTRKKKAELDEHKLGGFKFMNLVSGLLARLESKSDPRRKLHFDHYVTLLLFYFFNSTITSLRGLQASTKFKSVRRKLKVPRTSLGSLSAAQHVFDADMAAAIIPDLVARLPADKANPRFNDIKEIITLADGTLLKALPRIAWALWISETNRAAKAHVQFEVLKGAPCRADITAANASERDIFEGALESGRLYVMDSGYARFSLFQAIIDAGSNFVTRLPNSWDYEVLEERSLTQADRDSRVLKDSVVRLGSAQSRAAKSLKQRVRIIEIQRVEESSGRMRQERRARGETPRETIVIVTDRLDLPAEMIALLYAYRWKIEICQPCCLLKAISLFPEYGRVLPTVSASPVALEAA